MIDWRRQSPAGCHRVYPGGATTGPLPARHIALSVASPTHHRTGSASRPNQAAACFGLGDRSIVIPARNSAGTIRVSLAVAGQSSVRRDRPGGAAGPGGTVMEGGPRRYGGQFPVASRAKSESTLEEHQDCRDPAVCPGRRRVAAPVVRWVHATSRRGELEIWEDFNGFMEI